MPKLYQLFISIIAIVVATVSLAAQNTYSPAQLDLTANVASPVLESAVHKPLPEQYIGIPKSLGAIGKGTFCFRRTFDLPSVPRLATLYVAGQEQLRVYVNGRLLSNAERDPKYKLQPLVLTLPVQSTLRAGQNTIAVAMSGGDRLAVKIVPREVGVEGPALIMSDSNWKCKVSAESGWELPAYNDSAWPSVQSLGGIEGDGNIDFLRWNKDSGMYRWPGYDGISPYLAHLTVPVEHVVSSFDGLGKINNPSAIAPVQSNDSVLPSRSHDAQDLTVVLPPANATREEYPYVLFDLGRESDGRLEIVSDSDAPARVELQYGESQEEAINEPYLGVMPVLIPAHGTAHGPKSALRYAVVRFISGNSPLRFKAIRFDTIYYPVKYAGSFESSDPLLNRIWQVGAYTSHLSMQDEIWDAPKRDRAPYSGDLNVSGRVIDTVFADRQLMQRTMDDLIPNPTHPHIDYAVNGIPGYSAMWVMDQADYYRHIGDRGYLESIHKPLAELLAYMQTELDSRHLYVFGRPNRIWLFPFVDWSPDLNGDTPELNRATSLEFADAFSEGAWLLGELGDTAAADKFRGEAETMKQAARQYLRDPATNVFGPRWQTNAMAIYSGFADPVEKKAIWDEVLSRPRGFMVTPYYNFYVITAMAETGHRREALDWIRNYWGGMVSEGATSFWEAYDPDWSRNNYHFNLQADNGQGYFVSLCHGWSSGPTAWLPEQILGIQPRAAGFSEVSVRPDLLGLTWARGTEPTPHGPIKVDLKSSGAGLEVDLTLPAGVQADVSMPATVGSSKVQVNGKSIEGRTAEDGTRVIVDLHEAGTYRLDSASKPAN